MISQTWLNLAVLQIGQLIFLMGGPPRGPKQFSQAGPDLKNSHWVGSGLKTFRQLSRAGPDQPV